jgi:hypothetical protein
MPDDTRRLWYVEIKRDAERGPVFYNVHVRGSEFDPDLPASRQVTDIESLRAMVRSFKDQEISARAMFGGVERVTADKATDLLISEMGTRVVVKVTATRAELLASLALLKVG